MDIRNGRRRGEYPIRRGNYDSGAYERPTIIRLYSFTRIANVAHNRYWVLRTFEVPNKQYIRNIDRRFEPYRLHPSKEGRFMTTILKEKNWYHERKAIIHATFLSDSIEPVIRSFVIQELGDKGTLELYNFIDSLELKGIDRQHMKGIIYGEFQRSFVDSIEFRITIQNLE